MSNIRRVVNLQNIPWLGKKIAFTGTMNKSTQTDRLFINAPFVGVCPLGHSFFLVMACQPYRASQCRRSTVLLFTNYPSLVALILSELGSSCQEIESSSTAHLGFLVGLFMHIKHLNIVVQVLTTYLTNFKQNEHVKLTQTHENTQELFKVYVSNIMDVLGLLTSKHNKTSNTE